MLLELDIRDFALIASARVEFAQGLNVLSGETGVGKSLLVHAVSFLVGGKASPSLLRTGAKEAEVCGSFLLPSPSVAHAIEEIIASPVDADSPLLLRRTFSSAGASRAYIHGRPAPVHQLREVGALLVDLHGQHEHQSLLSPATQLDVLDRYAENDSRRDAFAASFREAKALEERLAALRASEADRARRLELLRHEAREVDLAQPAPGEVERLEAGRLRLANIERISSSVASAYAELHEEEGSALARLKRAQRELARAAELDPALRPELEALSDASARLSEAAFTLGRYDHEADPAERERLEERLDTLRRVLSKHGPAVEDVLRRRGEMEREIAELSLHAEETEGLDARIRSAQAELQKLGKALSSARQKAAKTLARRVEKELSELGMPHARLSVELAPLAAQATGPVEGWASAAGLERAEVLIVPNPGEAAQPLRKIASGGELARVMLALKTILAEADRVPVLVFDEVDANVGGRLGRVLGERLAGVASRRQVFCVTHLAPIAAFADRHILVTKATEGGRTTTRFQAIEGDTRIEELAEMVKGKPPTPTTRAQARELLRDAERARRGGS